MPSRKLGTGVKMTGYEGVDSVEVMITLKY
jgi:hypothetical protein